MVEWVIGGFRVEVLGDIPVSDFSLIELGDIPVFDFSVVGSPCNCSSQISWQVIFVQLSLPRQFSQAIRFATKDIREVKRRRRMGRLETTGSRFIKINLNDLMELVNCFQYS